MEHVNSGGASGSAEGNIPMGIDEEEETEEGIKNKGMKCGKRPSEEEVEEHERHQAVFRDWCKHCIFGKAVNNSHHKQEQEGTGMPHIVKDYMYLNEKFERGKRKTNIEGEGLPIVVIYDSRNRKGVYAFAVPN